MDAKEALNFPVDCALSSVQVGGTIVPVKRVLVGPYDRVRATGVYKAGCDAFVIFSVERSCGWLTVSEEIARVPVPQPFPERALTIEVH
jgi:hypothetical protein